MRKTIKFLKKRVLYIDKKINMKYEFIKKLQEFAKKNDLSQYVDKAFDKYSKRKNGKAFSLEAHLQAIIYSLLSNQRPWKRIEENKNKIDKIFFDYDVNMIKNTDSQYFINSLKAINCGNRSIKKQMQGLNDIISKLEAITNDHGSIDNYFINHTSMKKGYPYYLAKELADYNNKYKLKNMGIALVCEYFKNIGIDIAKPDTHIMRILGRSHLGFSNKNEATPAEAVAYIKEIADENHITQVEVDALLWLYCADGYGGICTKDTPRCGECVIRGWCGKSKTTLN